MGGYNLITPLLDYDSVIKQGINGPAWALIALDTIDYEGKEYSPTALNARYYSSGELFTALEEGILKGKLKEIVSKLDEEDNGVIMLLKQK